MRPTTDEQPSLVNALWVIVIVLGVVFFTLWAGGV